jgi:hypothetical protein
VLSTTTVASPGRQETAACLFLFNKPLKESRVSPIRGIRMASVCEKVRPWGSRAAPWRPGSRRPAASALRPRGDAARQLIVAVPRPRRSLALVFPPADRPRQRPAPAAAAEQPSRSDTGFRSVLLGLAEQFAKRASRRRQRASCSGNRRFRPPAMFGGAVGGSGTTPAPLTKPHARARGCLERMSYSHPACRKRQ